jgi:hypothetical protein
VDAGEAALDAVVAEGEAAVVKVEEPEDRGVEIVEGTDVCERTPPPWTPRSK